MKFILVVLSLLIPVSMSVYARDNIKIVGSSTVYPFSTLIAQNFVTKNKNFKTPIVEANGTGGGIKLFCQSPALVSPDIVDASREMTATEIAMCNSNGVKNITEIKFGYDAIVITSPKKLKDLSLTTEQLFLALASKVPDSQGNLINNPYKKWSDISKDLPNLPIKVMGPPSTSGTRDSFVEMVLIDGCKAFKSNTIDCNKLGKTIRNDGAWVSGGENDILMIKKVATSNNLLAVSGYSYYEQNQSLVNAVTIGGVSPNKLSLSNKTYKLIRPLFMYVKTDNIAIVPGLKDFMQEIVNTKTMRDKGYLQKAGLVVLDSKEYKALVAKVNKI